MTRITFRENTDSYADFPDGVEVSGRLGDVCSQYGNLLRSKEDELKFQIPEWNYGEYRGVDLPHGLEVEHCYGDYGWEGDGNVIVDEERFQNIEVHTDQRTGHCFLTYEEPSSSWKKKDAGKTYDFSLKEDVDDVRKTLQENGFLELPGREGEWHSQQKLELFENPEEEFDGKALEIVKQLQTLARQEWEDRNNFNERARPSFD